MLTIGMFMKMCLLYSIDFPEPLTNHASFESLYNIIMSAASLASNKIVPTQDTEPEHLRMYGVGLRLRLIGRIVDVHKLQTLS